MSGRTLERAQILVLDDEPANRRMLTMHFRLLADCPAEHLHEAATIAEAFAHRDRLRGEGKTLDICVVDYLLAGETGIDFLRRLRDDDPARFARTVRVMVTGCSMPGELDVLQRAADDLQAPVLTKPFGLAKIEALVREKLAALS